MTEHNHTHLQNLNKLAAVLQRDSEKASKADIETAILARRLDPIDYAKSVFRIMRNRFCRWVDGLNDHGRGSLAAHTFL